ncbi:MAG: SDR family NAD(P)-dependent oxidoreductase, partial [Myxococcota bacterium]
KLREIGVNYLAPLGLVSQLLPEMRGASRSIVAVSTLTVHVPFPGNASYAASKTALFTLLRSLRLELENDPVHIGAVLPGYTDTEMSRDVSSPIPAMPPARVARAVRDCIENERDCVVPGITNTVAARLFQSLPEVFDPLLGAFGRHLMAGGSSR